MFILLLTFLGTYEWYPVEGGNVTKEVLESSIVQQLGKNMLRKSFIKLDADIFEGGCTALLPKGYKIIEVPKGLKLMINHIEIENYDRYSAVYESGDLNKEWSNLKKEFADKIGVRYIRTPSLEALRKRLFKKGIDGSLRMSSADERGDNDEIEYTKKAYYSFLLIQKRNDRKLIPIFLTLSPVSEICKQIRREMSEVEGGEK